MAADKSTPGNKGFILELQMHAPDRGFSIRISCCPTCRRPVLPTLSVTPHILGGPSSRPASKNATNGTFPGK